MGRFLMKSVSRLFVVLGVVSVTVTARAEHPVRTWKSSDGRTIEAALVQADRTNVILKLRNGREATVPLERLSEEDRRHIATLAETGRTLRVGPMPEETKIDPNLPAEGGPKVYTTRHFTFECETEVTKAFISEASRVFEGTFEAVRALPLGIDPKPAEGETRFRTRFLERGTFVNEFLRNREEENTPPEGGPAVAPTGAGTDNVANVAGVYIPRRKEVLVPYSSLGVSMSGSKVSLRRSSDTSTLIHEVTHQVMHEWLAVTPLWVGEGLAEYLSAVPYQNGRFEFKNAAAGLKEALEQDFGIAEGREVMIHRPHELVDQSNAAWTGVPQDYLSALMLTYYFIHLDQPEKPCATLAAYLALLRDSREEVENHISEHNRAVREFEEKRLAYNEEVGKFNAALTAFKAEVDAYNGRVDTYNTQLRNGVPEGERIEVGAEPVAPTPPADLEVPEILRAAGDGRPVDFLAKMKNTARPALLRGRGNEQLDQEVVAAFAGMGIEVGFLPSAQPQRPVPMPSDGTGIKPINPGI